LLKQAEALMAGRPPTRRSAVQQRQRKLALTEWLVTRGWRPSSMRKRKKNRRLVQTFCRYSAFAGGGRAAQRVCISAGRRLCDQLPRLSRDIDSVQLLAGAYADAQAWLETGRASAAPLKRASASSLNISAPGAGCEPFWLHSGKR
jgi:triphosphatase